MKFGPVPVAQAAGALLAHSVALGRRRLHKGHVLGPADLEALAAAGHAQVMVARLDPGDVPEDAAALRLAQALVPDPDAACLRLTAPQNGRVNLKATAPGIVRLNSAAVVALNCIDPAITLATLPPMARVRAGALVGTVKIITYAVDHSALDAAGRVAIGAVGVQPVRLRTAGLVLTSVPGQAAHLAAKGRRAVETRLRALGMHLTAVQEVAHDEAAIATALTCVPGDMVLILTGSATSDPGDVAPSAVRRAGGTVTRFGIPVDPGNLLFYGTLAPPDASVAPTDTTGAGPTAGRPVIGLPGCARSPALNGADWFLERMACGHVPDAAEIAQMGLGGLLKEMPSRPQPREAPDP